MPIKIMQSLQSLVQSGHVVGSVVVTWPKFHGGVARCSPSKELPRLYSNFNTNIYEEYMDIIDTIPG